MDSDPILFAVFVIFSGAALLATVALLARQSLLVAYILLGVAIGPWGLALVAPAETVEEISRIGIIFLLFLLGINLHPQKLLKLLREALLVTLASSALFALAGWAIALAFGFGQRAALVTGLAMMFSSTIIGLKLLPTTALHHRHVGEVIISILLLQDLIAIAALAVLQGLGGGGRPAWHEVLLPVLALPVLAVLALIVEARVLAPLIRRFDTIQEYLFLVAIGWCLGLAQLAEVLGLSYEMGAFIAGVAFAANPVSTFVAESLKPLRDFFLVVFFVTLGAGFPLPALAEVALPALVLAATMLVLKPLVFRVLLRREGEAPRLAAEIGVRLGQISEFSLLIALIVQQSGVVASRTALLIESATLATFLVSSYWVMLRYPTPIAVSARLRQD